MPLSSFEAEIVPLKERGSFEAEYASFRSAHPKADHYPYAYRVGEYEKSSDDGEPGGSAGKAMLILLEERGIDCAALFVARYFGGTKLGVGRLRRCFMEAAKEAVENASFGEEKEFRKLRLRLSYGRYEELKRLCLKRGCRLENPSFGMEVEADLLIDGTIPSAEEDLCLDAGEILSRENVKEVVEENDDSSQ